MMIFKVKIVQECKEPTVEYINRFGTQCSSVMEVKNNSIQFNSHKNIVIKEMREKQKKR
jgi:hypothetical protein